MNKKFNILTLSLLILLLASCEKHDFFDENTITGAVGPETYWVVESSTAKAGVGMEFTAQYYSSVRNIDHSEVWYDLWERVDKSVSCALIKSLTYSYTSSESIKARELQTIQTYPHSEDLWSDSLHAYIFTNTFPISYTLSPVSWNPKDTIGFSKNLTTYFGADFAKNFKDELTTKLNPTSEERNFAAYQDVLKGLTLVDSAYMAWITDSTFDVSSMSWNKHFKQYDTIWSTTNFDTIGFEVDTTYDYINMGGRPPRIDTIMNLDTNYLVKPWVDKVNYVYDQIKDTIDALWNNVTFIDLIEKTDGYAIEYQKNYLINAELRVYDDEGVYSKTDSKEISIN